MLDIKGNNLFRFLRKTVLNGKYCDIFDNNEKDITFTQEEIDRVIGYINVLHVHDRVLLLNCMQLNNCHVDILNIFPEEMKFVKDNYKNKKWDFYTKRGFKDKIKEIFKADEVEQG